MKHTWKITFVLLGMFLITQLIGLAVVYSYTYIPKIPYGMEPPEEVDPISGLISTVIAFVLAILLVLLLNKYRVKFVLRTWFFVVILIALGITFYSILFYVPFFDSLSTKIVYLGNWEIFSILEIISFALAIIPAYYKIYRQNMIVHNLTELLIYPGIGAVFVSFFFYSLNPFLSIASVTVLLIMISIYDIWAVNHSGIMQKMAKFQINELKLFAGFYIPYMDKKQREEIKMIKQKYQKKDLNKVLEKKKFKISLAILGGGDVIFPIIAAGIFMKVFNSVIPALFITAGATAALFYLFVVAKKGKFYPAMPFLSGGIFIGMILGFLYSLI